MTLPPILIMMGVSGSGKTKIGQQLAADLGWDFFDGDDFHPQENIAKMRQSIPLTDADRAAWLNTLRDLIRRQLEANQPAVVACSALKQGYREHLKVSPSVQFVYLKGSYELIYQRINERTNHYMPADLLDSQFETLEEPASALVIDASMSPETIVKTIKYELLKQTR